MNLHLLRDPALSHLESASAPFFEGWYFRVTSPGGRSLVLIPGAALSGQDSHSFLQLLDSGGQGQPPAYYYERFAPDTLYCSPDHLFILQAGCVFSQDGMQLHLQTGQLSLAGSLIFSNRTHWPEGLVSRGNMGLWGTLPGLECYSHVCVVDGAVRGQVTLNGEEIDFSGGSLYIEKNWGRSFPSRWFWAQCTDHGEDRVSLSCSVASVPLGPAQMTGFLLGMKLNDQFFPFTTANNSCLRLIHYRNGTLLETQRGHLRLTARVFPGRQMVALKAPGSGKMVRQGYETLSGRIQLELYDLREGLCLYNKTLPHCGVEYGGSWTPAFACGQGAGGQGTAAG